jgi:hypothetical protein
VIETLADVRSPGLRDNLAHHAGKNKLLRAHRVETERKVRERYARREPSKPAAPVYHM